MYTYYNKLFAVFYATFLNSILAVYLCGVFAMCYVRYICFSTFCIIELRCNNCNYSISTIHVIVMLGTFRSL